MATRIRLKKLLRREQIALLLADFAPLLGPETALAVSDDAGHLLGNHRPFPPSTVRALWNAILEQLSTTNEAEALGEIRWKPNLDQVVITSEGAVTLLCVQTQPVGLILAAGPPPRLPQTQTVLNALRQALESLASTALERRAIAQETLDRYREINLLYDVGETLATCLNVDELLQRVLTQASEIMQAQQGAVLLRGQTGKLTVAASNRLTEELERAIQEERTMADEVVRTGKPWITSAFDILEDGKQQTPLLAVPLRTSERPLGVVLLAGKAGGGVFTAGDEKLLSALAWQAAIALENARLFDNALQQRDQIAAMKHYMDDIFASIASGVITIDTHDIITSFNRAAETILRLPAQQVLHRPYHQELSFLRSTALPSLIEDVRQHNKTYVDQEICPFLPQGEQLHLSVSLSLLEGGEGEARGIVIVMNDVTDKHRYERERTLISRYLPYGLVDRLPKDLAELGLQGERRVVTAFFTDIRGFTGLSEANPPEWVMEVLNRYLTLAEAAVRFNQGIVDKYMGDAVMALFNTPLVENEDHAWQAVQAAWTLKKAVESHHRDVAPEERLFLGTGICTGEAVVGNVGTEDRMEYTAIGDTVNLAKRLQESTQPGQILINHATWEQVRDRVHVNPLPAIQLRGRRTITRIYEVIDVMKPSE